MDVEKLVAELRSDLHAGRVPRQHQAADALEALAKELAEARAIVGELVDRDLSYQGENIVIPTAGHGNAIALVSRARRFLEGK